jgi:hypothetical protein
LPLKIKFSTLIFKINTNTRYLTSDLWDKFHNRQFEKEYFDIPELKIQGFLQEACKQIINLTWRYNENVEKQIKELISPLNLPQHYLGLHIRGGDKLLEHKQEQVEKYIDLAIKNSNLRDAFVLTDDYAIIIELRTKFPDWNFWTLCNEREAGYFHSDFSNSSTFQKKLNMIKLFASIEILYRSKMFIGTFSSNPGMYLGMRMAKDKTRGVDFEKWRIW